MSPEYRWVTDEALEVNTQGQQEERAEDSALGNTRI